MKVVANGYTLIELLAALVAGSLLLLGLGWSLDGLRSDLMRSDTERVTDHLARLAPLLRGHIEVMAAPTPGYPGPHLANDQLTLISDAPRSLGITGPVRAAFNITGPVGDRRLGVVYQPKDSNAGQARQLELISGMADIKMSLQPAKPSLLPKLPQSVTFTFVTERNDHIEIVGVPRLNATGSCRFDPVSLQCRP